MILPAHSADFNLTADLINGLRVKYPHLDVQSELYKANLWLAKNPASRPKLMLRFLEKWLSRAKPKMVKIHLVNGKMTEPEILELARRLNVEPLPGEPWEKFGCRLQRHMDASQA